jgi:hypothetical protein
VTRARNRLNSLWFITETTIITITPTSVATRAMSPSLDVGELEPFVVRFSSDVICQILTSTV